MNIFGIGLPEMAVIFVVALLIFGPKKLPEIGRSLGKAIRSFQDASKEFESEFKRETAKLEQAQSQSQLTQSQLTQSQLTQPSTATSAQTASEAIAQAEPEAEPIAKEAEAQTMAAVVEVQTVEPATTEPKEAAKADS
ncbi:MAG: TatA/E family twin arginine-targeting protein translocase [Coleofasciculaceae cyanobacterium SM2_3_26]|nr:TatA/E family twin arginine-targeting protein translocase [Coleofasciculaceae cyanobacterium SM2_3_26]